MTIARNEILIAEKGCRPGTLSVGRGQPVTWVNGMRYPIFVHVRGWTSKPLAPGARATRRFASPGAVRFKCPAGGARMLVVVR